MTQSQINANPEFIHRHIGPDDAEIQQMLQTLNYPSLDALVDATIPADIRLKNPLALPCPRSESDVLAELRSIAIKNKIHRSFLGQGYYGTITPPVIQRNILENPGWYTQYTPYQAEISQGRLEALMNFQTMIADLTGLPIANASLLDEATAAAEAMAMAHSIVDDPAKPTFFISDKCHPQTIAVVKTRAQALGIPITVGDEQTLFSLQPSPFSLFGILLQYPATDGSILDYSPLIQAAHKAGALAIVATDLLALTLIKPPGEWGADIAIGSAQRFGVPMGFGGPHAAFMATKPEYVRKMPGRLVGLSKDALGNPAYRLALQTREQHIRREKATSNICTAQVLLAIMASMYAVYHGPEGLKAIATRIAKRAGLLVASFSDVGVKDVQLGFDTVKVSLPGTENRKYQDAIRKISATRGINLRHEDAAVIISVDETTTEDDVADIINVFVDAARDTKVRLIEYQLDMDAFFFKTIERTSPFLTHPVFNTHHSETEMLRYIKQLESRDLSLCQSMIPLGSCTMKLNATAEMIPVTWPEFANLHPFAPADQTAGYQELFAQLEAQLAAITGLPAVSLQPNAGSQGEYAGLLTIRAYHEAQSQSAADAPVGSPSGAMVLRSSQGHAQRAPSSPTQEEGAGPSQHSAPSTQHSSPRNICLIPTSAHGTNPASAVVAGFTVIPINCDEQGNIDLADLQAKATEHAPHLGALMLTYPSTHGVFEPAVKQICQIIHAHGGQVYMDGANMNAQCGLTSPAEIGADICHLNLHKTFCIPHGGGGPGMGPICAAPHLAAFLPASPLSTQNSALSTSSGPVSAAPHGSACILPISWTYIALMGAQGLTKASQVAILSANYMAKRLEAHYPVRFRGPNGTCAHEFIIDCRSFESSANVKVEDIAKRLMDYGFHAPTMSWPEVGTLMIEPTESEPKAELDRLCDALIAIRQEIRDIEEGRADRTNNPLKNSPHPARAVTATEWPHPYPREQAAYPAPWLLTQKFWPHVARIDNPYGDRNLVCTCNTP